MVESRSVAIKEGVEGSTAQLSGFGGDHGQVIQDLSSLLFCFSACPEVTLVMYSEINMLILGLNTP